MVVGRGGGFGGCFVDRDHDVWTPSLTGMGDRAHLNSEPPALSTWISDITELLHAEDLTDVVLVGHSQGGLVVGPVAATSDRVAVDRLPGRTVTVARRARRRSSVPAAPSMIPSSRRGTPGSRRRHWSPATTSTTTPRRG